MKALSLWQPWASAIALGLKRIETRGWYTKYRGPIAIHAAKRWTADERHFHAAEVARGTMPADIPLGAIVATARIVDVLSTDKLISRIGIVEESWGNYEPGRFGFVLEGIETLAQPIPYRGAQGLFDIPEEVLGLTPAPSPQGRLI